MAAVGTAGFYIKLGWSLISVITIGTMVSVSHSIGAEKKDRIQHFISCGIRSTFVLGIFYALFVFYAGRASYIPFQYRKTGSKHDGSELSEDKQYHCSYHVYEPFVYRHYRRTRKDTVLVQGGTFMGISSISFLTLCLYFISDWEWKVRHGLRHFHSGVP